MIKTEVRHSAEFRERLSPFSWSMQAQRRICTITVTLQEHSILGGAIKWYTKLDEKREWGKWEDVNEYSSDC